MQTDSSNRSFLFTATSALLCGLAALVVVMPASADSAAKQKTTGSHIARESRGDADSVRLEPVEVMIGAVRDARHESREPASNAPQLPLLDSTALLDDTSSAQQPH